MATVEPKSMAVSLAQPPSKMYTIDIAMSTFTDAETTAGGRLSPCAADDFATKPTTLAQSLLVSRGQLRFKLMMNALQVRSNVNLHNMVCTYASDSGDSPITDINFTLIYENADFVFRVKRILFFRIPGEENAEICYSGLGKYCFLRFHTFIIN